MANQVSILEVIKTLNLDCINEASKDCYITTADVYRPGMQLVGYYKHFPFERIQVIGQAEYAYISELTEEERVSKLNDFFSYDIPLVCFTRGNPIPEDLIHLAQVHDKFIVSTDLPTTRFVSRISDYINDKIAPIEVVHGVLVDVDGLGILIKGDSGIGKSEAALELIQRGHRFVSDDAVEIKRLEEDVLVGQSPEITRHIMEIRGIGILDIKSLYGVGAVKPSKTIDLVATLEKWEDGKYYDRLGMDEEYVDMLGVKIAHMVIPIRPGRNISVILEIAARNQRQKYMGYNAAVQLNERLMSKLLESAEANP